MHFWMSLGFFEYFSSAKISTKFNQIFAVFLRPYVSLYSSHHSAWLKYVENCNHETNKSIPFDTECPVYINNAKGSLFLLCCALNRCALYLMSKLHLWGKHSFSKNNNNYYSAVIYWTLSRDVEWSLIHCVLQYFFVNFLR